MPRDNGDQKLTSNQNWMNIMRLCGSAISIGADRMSVDSCTSFIPETPSPVASECLHGIRLAAAAPLMLTISDDTSYALSSPYPPSTCNSTSNSLSSPYPPSKCNSSSREHDDHGSGRRVLFFSECPITNLPVNSKLCGKLHASAQVLCACVFVRVDVNPCLYFY